MHRYVFPNNVVTDVHLQAETHKTNKTFSSMVSPWIAPTCFNESTDAFYLSSVLCQRRRSCVLSKAKIHELVLIFVFCWLQRIRYLRSASADFNGVTIGTSHIIVMSRGNTNRYYFCQTFSINFFTG